MLKRLSLMLTSALVILAAIQTPAQVSSADKARLLDLLQRTQQEIVNESKGLSSEQLAFKAAPERWSIAEVLEHIVLAENLIFDLTTQVLKTTPQPTKKDPKKQQENDALILKVILDRSAKFQAPEPLKPTHQWSTGAALIEEFNKRRGRTIEFVRTTDLDLRSYFRDSPLMKDMDGYQWLLFLNAHSQRHLAQLREVKASPGFPQAQSGSQTNPPAFDLDRYQFGMLRRGPKWTPESTPETQKIQAGHMDNIGKMASTGKLIAAGPMLDNGDLRGIFLFKTDSVEEATKLAAEDPAIKAGRLALELVTWMAPRGIGARFNEEYRKDPANARTTMTKYHLAFLRGKSGGDVQPASSQQIHLDHLWNIRRMLDSGRLVAAGPFVGNGEVRGVFVFATESMDEARAWAESDPAVKAGLMTVELHPWLVAKEVWPAGTAR
jgi:uncharacterized protein YciI